MQYLMDHLEEHLNFWGYTDVPDKNNQFAFFDYKEKANRLYQDQYKGFKKLNEETWEWVSTHPERVDAARQDINLGSEGISMFREKQIHKFLPLPTKSTIKDKTPG